MRDAASEHERGGRAVPFGIGCGKMDSEKQEKEGVTIEHMPLDEGAGKGANAVNSRPNTEVDATQV